MCPCVCSEVRCSAFKQKYNARDGPSICFCTAKIRRVAMLLSSSYPFVILFVAFRDMSLQGLMTVKMFRTPSSYTMLLLKYCDGSRLHPFQHLKIALKKSAHKTVATVLAIGIDTSCVIPISRINFLLRLKSYGDGRRRHSVSHPRDVCTPFLYLLFMRWNRWGDDSRFLLMYFVRRLPHTFVFAFVRRKQKRVSEGTAIQTERSFLLC